MRKTEFPRTQLTNSLEGGLGSQQWRGEQGFSTASSWYSAAWHLRGAWPVLLLGCLHGVYFPLQGPLGDGKCMGSGREDLGSS